MTGRWMDFCEYGAAGTPGPERSASGRRNMVGGISSPADSDRGPAPRRPPEPPHPVRRRVRGDGPRGYPRPPRAP